MFRKILNYLHDFHLFQPINIYTKIGHFKLIHLVLRLLCPSIIVQYSLHNLVFTSFVFITFLYFYNGNRYLKEFIHYIVHNLCPCGLDSYISVCIEFTSKRKIPIAYANVRHQYVGRIVVVGGFSLECDSQGVVGACCPWNYQKRVIKWQH